MDDFFTRLTNALDKLAPTGSMARGIALLTGGTAFAQGVTVLALPFLTRLYSPEDFAILAIYVALLGIVTTVSCLRFNIAIPIPKDDKDGMSLLVMALASALCITLLSAIPFGLLRNQTAQLLNRPEIASYLWLLIPGIAFASIYNALQYWASRKKRFKLVTQTRVIRSVGMVSTQFALGVASATPFGLILGQVVYTAMGIIGLGRSLLINDKQALREQRAQNVIAQIKQYKGFAYLSTPEALFNSAGVQLPVIIIAAVVAGTEAGFVMLAMRVMGMPMALVGSSVSQVYLAEAAERERHGELGALTWRMMGKLLKLGGPILALVGISAPFVFPIVFGTEWQRAGVIVAWMTPWFILQFITSPVSSLLHVRGFLGTALMLQVCGFAIRVGAVSISAVVAIGWISEIYALSGAMFYILYLVAVVNIANREKVNYHHERL